MRKRLRLLIFACVTLSFFEIETYARPWDNIEEGSDFVRVGNSGRPTLKVLDPEANDNNAPNKEAPTEKETVSTDTSIQTSTKNLKAKYPIEKFMEKSKDISYMMYSLLGRLDPKALNQLRHTSPWFQACLEGYFKRWSLGT